MPSINTVITTGNVSIDYTTLDPDREITDLAIVNSPIINLIDLTWSHPTTQGTYEVWYNTGGAWIDSGLSTTGTSITVDLPEAATELQLRNSTQASNNVFIIYQEVPPAVTLTATNRYDGVQINWTPEISDNIEILRGATVVFTGPAPSSSYFVDTDATTTSANYTATTYIGTKPSDFAESAVSNSVAGNKLTAPPYNEPADVAADGFIGIKPGTGITDTGTDELGNPVPVEPAHGVMVLTSASGEEADLIGTRPDEDDTVLFHSDNQYILVDSIIELTSFTTTSDLRRRFTLTAAAITALDAGNCFLVRFDSSGTKFYGNPIFKRKVEWNQTVTDTYSLDFWRFESGGHYETGDTYLEVSNTSVDSVRLYFINVQVNGTELEYIDRAVPALDPGGAGEIYIDGTSFIVNGIDFGAYKFLCNLGTSTDGEYVEGLRNLYDDVIPLKDGATVDTALFNYGGGECLQVLGSYPGQSGWKMDFDVGKIWRTASGNDIEWWNAAKGRTRLKMEQVTSRNTDLSQYLTEARTIDIPTPNQGFTDIITDRVHNSSGSLIPVGVPDVSINIPKVYSSSIFGLSITPKDWVTANQGTYDLVYLSEAQTTIFSAFAVGVDYVPVYKYSAIGRSPAQYDGNGEPFYDTWITLNATVYLHRVTDFNFRLYYSFNCGAFSGSVQIEDEPIQDGAQIRIPRLTYSFIHMR